MAPENETSPVEGYKYEYTRSAIPLEKAPILTAPENSDGKWLLPVLDLKSDVKIDAGKTVLPERTYSDDEI